MITRTPLVVVADIESVVARGLLGVMRRSADLVRVADAGEALHRATSGGVQAVIVRRSDAYGFAARCATVGVVCGISAADSDVVVIRDGVTTSVHNPTPEELGALLLES